MRKILLITFIFVAAAAGASGQAPRAAGEAPETLRLSVDEAVRMALDHNVDLAADRIDPQIGGTEVAAAAGAFRPVFGTGFHRNDGLQPPANFLVPIATRTNATTTDVGVNQQLPWLGTSYSIAWNVAHTTSNSFLTSFNPLVQSGLSLNISQPLVRNLSIDAARQQLATSRIGYDIAGTRVRESVVRTAANVKTAYWNLVTAVANVGARKSALELAEELVRVNTAKVKVGQVPPLDLVAAEAEVAADQEQLIVAETTVQNVEDQLRALILDTTDRGAWHVAIQPVDSPPVGTAPPDLEAAVSTALRDRADLARARKEIDRAQVDVKYTDNQRLPDVRLDASYLASGLGGTQLLRTSDFPGTIVGTGGVTGFGSMLSDLFTGRYSTWAVGVSVHYPLGRSTEEAEFARARLQHQEAQQRLKGAESRAIQQVRDAWRKIAMNAKRIDATRAARQLAAERLDAERKRFDVGISTSFLVIQAQRDLAQARTNELAAVLAYDLSLVDFEAVQQAGPAPSAPTDPALVAFDR